MGKIISIQDHLNKKEECPFPIIKGRVYYASLQYVLNKITRTRINYLPKGVKFTPVKDDKEYLETLNDILEEADVPFVFSSDFIRGKRFKTYIETLDGKKFYTMKILGSEQITISHHDEGIHKVLTREPMRFMYRLDE